MNAADSPEAGRHPWMRSLDARSGDHGTGKSAAPETGRLHF